MLRNVGCSATQHGMQHTTLCSSCNPKCLRPTSSSSLTWCTDMLAWAMRTFFAFLQKQRLVVGLAAWDGQSS
jgi:hypothetical protein